MKIKKTASSKINLTLSKKEWQEMGKKAGWIKKAQSDFNLERDMPTDPAFEDTAPEDSNYPGFQSENDESGYEAFLIGFEQLCSENELDSSSISEEQKRALYESGKNNPAGVYSPLAPYVKPS
jgi:hypothetical protein